MPNWCSNKLTIKGPTNLREELQELIHGAYKPLSFSALVPRPTGIENRPPCTSLEHIASGAGLHEDELDLYAWSCSKWGTKWDVDSKGSFCTLETTPKTLLYEFDTAWSPPIPFVATIAARYPDLVFELNFREEGMGFAGKSVWKNGTLHSEKDFAPGSSGYRRF